MAESYEFGQPAADSPHPPPSIHRYHALRTSDPGYALEDKMVFLEVQIGLALTHPS